MCGKFRLIEDAVNLINVWHNRIEFVYWVLRIRPEAGWSNYEQVEPAFIEKDWDELWLRVKG